MAREFMASLTIERDAATHECHGGRMLLWPAARATPQLSTQPGARGLRASADGLYTRVTMSLPHRHSGTTLPPSALACSVNCLPPETEPFNEVTCLRRTAR